VIASTIGSHCVHFYEPNLFPSKDIADFIRKGIVKNESIVLVASRDHAVQIESEIESFETQVQGLRSSGLWSVVSTDILQRALLSGVSIERLLANVLSPTVQMACEKSPAGRIRIYGEFVDVVLKLGKPDVCLELERYASQIASENASDVYCGYSTDAFPDAGCARQFTKVCLLHNLIHINLEDNTDWRHQMALGIAQAQSDSFLK
jgi:MEDS: MEthanogen/methylotroph, DcmR Sensory domain